MKRHHRRRAIRAGTVVTVIGGLVTVGIRFDDHLLDRQKAVAQMKYERAVRECELSGGRWWRGTCERNP